jgi:multidrug efflux pump
LRTGDINTARAFLIFSDWDERQHTADEIMQPVLAAARKLPGVRVSMGRPGGLGRGGLQSPIVAVIGGPDYEHLALWSDQMLQLAQANPGLANVQSNYKERKPQIRVSIDRDRAADLGISLERVGRTLETVLGSRIVTTYIDRGREYNVILQGRDDIRETTTDLTNIRVRSNRTDELIPLSSVVHLQETSGTIQLSRFDRLRAIKISADLANGYTMGEAVKWFQDTVAREVPEANLSWDGQTREFTRTGQQLYFTFLLALAVVYLVLAAQFESFVHPIIIMVTVPLALLGAVFGLKLFGLTVNIFSQIAVIMLVGIAAKNGVLIVEFANQLRDRGLAFTDAIVQAAVTRLRPVLMTSFCTAFGALPLMLASGAGAEQRRPIGIVVFFGMTVAVFLTLFAVPTVYGLLARKTKSPQHVSRLVDRLMGGGAGGVSEAVAHDLRRD